jgi:flavodoxin I
MKAIAIFYGTTTGNTQAVAETIVKKLVGKQVDLYDVADAKIEDIEKYDNLIFGTSTWGLGELQDDWTNFLPRLQRANLKGKIVALFGLGDAESYADTFVDGMGEIYQAIFSKGCTIVGCTQTTDYTFTASKAVLDNSFVGLPLDQDNESQRISSQLDRWLQLIVPNFN